MLDLPVSFLGWYNLFKDYLGRGIFYETIGKTDDGGVSEPVSSAGGSVRGAHGSGKGRRG